MAQYFPEKTERQRYAGITLVKVENVLRCLSYQDQIFVIMSFKVCDHFSWRGNKDLTLPAKQEILLARGDLQGLCPPEETQWHVIKRWL